MQHSEPDVAARLLDRREQRGSRCIHRGKSTRRKVECAAVADRKNRDERGLTDPSIVLENFAFPTDPNARARAIKKLTKGKAQTLRFVDGYADARDFPVDEVPEVWGEDETIPTKPNSVQKEVEPTSLPKWVKYDRQVLRFFATAKESNELGFFILYFYLVDDTVQVESCRDSKGNRPHVPFINRHVATDGFTGTNISFSSLTVGDKVEIFKHVFTLCACDAFTRDFLRENGFPQPADRETGNPSETAQATESFSAAAKTIRTSSVDKRQFYKHDGQVLCFTACLPSPVEDQSQTEPARTFAIRYFLGDDTVEVIETSARKRTDQYKKFLVRQLLPKRSTCPLDFTSADSPGQFDEKLHVHWKELRVGHHIWIFGREVLLTGVDAFTKQWYKEHMHLEEKEMETLPVDLPIPSPVSRQVAKHDGIAAIGSQEDSMQNCLSLLPRPCRKNWHQWAENQGRVLSIKARFARPCEEDTERSFVFQYHLEDGTIAIFEETQKGRQGGKFLGRTKVPCPDAERYYTEEDLKVGDHLVVFGHEYVLESYDEYTRKFFDRVSPCVDCTT